MAPIEPPHFDSQPFNIATPSPAPTDTSNEDTSTFELTLITLALLCSIVLSLIPPSKQLSRTRHLLHTYLTVNLAVLSSAGAIVLSVIALTFGWARKISLDALAGVVFALAPGLTQLPRETLTYGFNAFRMGRRKSLNLKSHNFRYIRIGSRCGTDKNAANVYWTENFSPYCHAAACPVRLYIRILPLPEPSHLSSLFSRHPQDFFGPGILNQTSTSSSSSSPHADPPNTAMQPPQPQIAPGSPSSALAILGDPDYMRDPNGKGYLQWHGRRVGHTKNYVQLRDLEHGISAWWWEAISSEMDLLERPLKYIVKNKARMLNALALLSDIISIGDLVIRYRINLLHMQLSCDRGIQIAVTATPGYMCNALLKALGLDTSWGLIGPEILKNFVLYLGR